MNQALANRVRNRLITSNAVASHSHVLGALREEGVVLSEESVDELVLILEREFNGAGVLQPLSPRCAHGLLRNREETWRLSSSCHTGRAPVVLHTL